MAATEMTTAAVTVADVMSISAAGKPLFFLQVALLDNLPSSSSSLGPLQVVSV